LSYDEQCVPVEPSAINPEYDEVIHSNSDILFIAANIFILALRHNTRCKQVASNTKTYALTDWKPQCTVTPGIHQ